MMSSTDAKKRMMIGFVKQKGLLRMEAEKCITLMRTLKIV